MSKRPSISEMKFGFWLLVSLCVVFILAELFGFSEALINLETSRTFICSLGLT